TILEPEDSAFAVAGLRPPLTPTSEHYLVEIDLEPPVIGAAEWRLDVTGAVARPLHLSLSDLRAMRTIEQPVLLTCISNTVGGRLAGDSLWTGVPLVDLLASAGALPAASTLS